MVAFVSALPKALQVRRDETYYSGLASTRLRLLIPACELSRRVPVWLVPLEEFVARPDLSHLGRSLAVVIGKLSSDDVIARETLLRKLIGAARRVSQECPLYADLSDDYAALGKATERPFLKEYQRLLGAVCEFTVPTRALADAVRRDARLGLHVIEDPYESATAQPVKTGAGERPRLAWFGRLGEVNRAMCEDELLQLGERARDTPLALEIVAQLEARQTVEAMAQQLRRVHPDFLLSFTAWSVAATEAAISRCDYVWLPQDHRSAWGRVKSHNRLVAAIRGGRLALASPIPAYQELAAYAWVGEDLAQGLDWALGNPREAARRVAEGQSYVEARFSPEAVGRRWADVLGVPRIAAAGFEPA